MDANRIINNVFEESAVEAVGVSYNAVVKSSDALMEWTRNQIHRSATAFEPVNGITIPYILNMALNVSSIFMPGGRERLTIVCGSLFVFEEPFKTLEDDDLTIVSVIEEFKKVLFTDPYLAAGGDRKAERLHGFQIQSYGGKVSPDKVQLHVAYRTEYLLDLNFSTRGKM